MQASIEGLTPLPAPFLPPHLAAGGHNVMGQELLPGVPLDPWGFRNGHACQNLRCCKDRHGCSLGKAYSRAGAELAARRGKPPGVWQPHILQPPAASCARTKQQLVPCPAGTAGTASARCPSSPASYHQPVAIGRPCHGLQTIAHLQSSRDGVPVPEARHGGAAKQLHAGAPHPLALLLLLACAQAAASAGCSADFIDGDQKHASGSC